MPSGQVITGHGLSLKKEEEEEEKKKRALRPSRVLTMQQTLHPHQQTQADFTLILLIERNIQKCTVPAACPLFPSLSLPLSHIISSISEILQICLWGDLL